MVHDVPYSKRKYVCIACKAGPFTGTDDALSHAHEEHEDELDQAIFDAEMDFIMEHFSEILSES